MNTMQWKRMIVATGVMMSLVVCIYALTPDAELATSLSYTLGDRGVSSLSYNGQVLAKDDAMTIEYAAFQRPDGTVTNFNGWEAVKWLPRVGNTVIAVEPWGQVSCTYTQVGDTLRMALSILNSTTNTLVGSELRIQNFTIPNLGQAKFWTFGVDMCWASDSPNKGFGAWASGLGVIPLIQCDYATGCVAFGQAEFPGGAGELGVTDTDVMFQNPAEGYPLFSKIHMGGIEPGKTKIRQFFWRFAPAGTDPYVPTNYLCDVFEKYSASKPMLVEWTDRRPIIQEPVLANGITATPQNPHCYHTGQDLRTDAGKAGFRAELMARADDYIAKMKRANAQGIVFWSIEGIENVGVMYEGDPTRVAFAPEMEYKDASGVATVDAFLKRFTDAGFRVGHCLRPQELSGVPLGHHDTPDPARILIDKINYCKKRWGSTLYYVDSTVRSNGQGGWDVLDGSVFRRVQEACPDVLVMPENQCSDDYASAAPWDEGGHHLVYHTPRKVLAIWPGAFSAINCDPSRNFSSNVIPLYVEGVKQGNILFFQPWEKDEALVTSVYKLAGSPPVARIVAPANGSTFKPGSLLTITVDATDSDGTIAKVEFYASTLAAGRAKLGEVTRAPYQFQWKNAPAGRQVLSVRAVDNAGLERWPASVVITGSVGK